MAITTAAEAIPGAPEAPTAHPPFEGYHPRARLVRMIVLVFTGVLAALGIGAVVAAPASAGTNAINGTVDAAITSWAPDLAGLTTPLTAPVTFTVDKTLPAGLAFDAGVPGTPEVIGTPAVPATADTPAVPAVVLVPAVPTIPGTGAITGTPTEACATTTFTVTATDSAVPPNVATFTVAITIDGVMTASPAPVSATVGEPITKAPGFAPKGLTAPITYAATNGPAWLDLTDGVVAGTPDVALPSTTFDVTATDAHGAVARGTFDLEVLPSLGRQNLTGLVNVALAPTQLLQAVPLGDYAIDPTFATTGLSFDTATGIVSGTATAPIVQTTYAIVKHDVVGGPVTARGSISIRVDAVLGAAAQRLNGLAGTAITPYTPFAQANLVTAGLVTPATFTVDPALPDGLSLDPATGGITGTPTGFLPATTFTIGVTDAKGAKASGTFTASILGRPLPSTQEISGKVGAFVTTAPLTAQGWTAPLRFTITPTLPTGLIFNPNRGSITGVPIAVLPTTVFDITATDAKGTTSHATVSLTIAKGVLLPPIVSVIGGTDPGSLQVSFVKPVLAPIGQTYSIQVSDAARQNLVTSVDVTTPSTFIESLTPGSTYSVVVVVNESENFLRIESLPKTGKATATPLVVAREPSAATVPEFAARVLIPQIGLILADGSQVKNAKPLRVKASPTRSLNASPRVRVAPSTFRRIVLTGVALDGSLQVRILVDGTWQFVGTVAGASSGEVTLPVFSILKPGTYPVQLVPVTGKPVFIRLVVGKAKKAGRAPRVDLG